MRRGVWIGLMLWAGPACAGAPVLPALTPVEVEILTPLSSDSARVGGLFALRLHRPIEQDGAVVVPAGTLGVGEVVEAKRAHGSGAPGVLILAADYLELGGRQLRLRSLRLTKVGADAVGAVNRQAERAMGAAAAPVALLNLGTRGADVAVEAGAVAEAQTAEDFALAAPGAPPPEPAVAAPYDPLALPPPPPGMGLVVFFRPAAVFGMGLGCGISESGQKLSSLGNGRWFVLLTAPGRHAFRSKGETADELNLLVEPDETQFVSCHIRMGALYGRPDLRPADPHEFRSVGRLRLVDADDMGAKVGASVALRPDEIAAALKASAQRTEVAVAHGGHGGGGGAGGKVEPEHMRSEQALIRAAESRQGIVTIGHTTTHETARTISSRTTPTRVNSSVANAVVDEVLERVSQ